jgi:hypothetical protein
MAHFQRLVRFEDYQGQTHHGELDADTPWNAELTEIEVKTYTPDIEPWSDLFQLTGKTAKIAKVRKSMGLL